MVTRREADEGFDGERFVDASLLGRGQFGSVYRAFDRQRRAHVALKVLHDPASESAWHLKLEFRTLSGIAHPNVIELLDLIVSPRHACFTMELLEVLRWLERRRAQDRDAIDLDREQVLLRAERNDPPPEAQAEMAQTARAAAEGEVAERARRLLARGLKARGLL